MILRDYQREAVTQCVEALKRHTSVLIVMPTGTGKTIVFAAILDALNVRRGMVIAHREELITQAVDKIERSTDLSVDIEMADWRASELHQTRVVVSTVQTQCAGNRGLGRMHRFPPGDFDALVVDEAHHAVASTYKRTIDHYRTNPDLKVIGVTATPDRKDEKALGQIFQHVPYVYELLDAINDGWLVPIHARPVIDVDIDFSKARTTAGDLNKKDLAAIMEAETALQEITTPAFEIADGRKTLVFAASVAHAELMCDIFNRHYADCARFVCGKTPKQERRNMFRDYAKGRFQILCNVGVATEGFDEPGIECIIMARPTKSRALAAQMCGRGTRPLAGVVDGLESPDERISAIAASGKPHVEIVDFVGNTGKHKLVYSADILGGNYSDTVVARAWSDIRKADKPVDLREAMDGAREAIKAEREAERERRKNVVAKATYTVGSIDLFNQLDVTPWRVRGWDLDKPPSDKMIALLEKYGVAVDGMNFTQARQACGVLIDRSKKGLCSYKQARLLNRFGYNTSALYRTEASRLITKLKENGWKR
jgi:superfamily II DNA or RNA helicase